MVGLILVEQLTLGNGQEINKGGNEMPTKEEMARDIVEMLSINNNPIPPTIEEFMAIFREKERVTGSTAQPKNTLKQMYDAYNDLQEEFGGRGITDTEEQLNDLDEKQLDTLWKKIKWANGVIVITHDNSPEEQ